MSVADIPPKPQEVPANPRDALREARALAEAATRLLAQYREVWELAYHDGSPAFKNSTAGERLSYALAGYHGLETAVRALDLALETLP